uniref:PDZ domain-containing protein n=1 Tax=Tetraodon nigroviridis TaxID=99883 RepID=H3C8B9_TETNG
MVFFIFRYFFVTSPPPTVILPAEEPGRGVRGFTRDPTQLQGTMLQTALRKSPQGFGFTIIGGDRPDEFLQVKNVLLDGPAAHDNKIASGSDVIVDINGTCVLGKTHADVVQMFQSIPINQYVDMVLGLRWPLHTEALSPDRPLLGYSASARAGERGPGQGPRRFRLRHRRLPPGPKGEDDPGCSVVSRLVEGRRHQGDQQAECSDLESLPGGGHPQRPARGQ